MYIKPPKFVRRIFPSLVWEMPPSEEVYLTFDDGPTPGVTEMILEQLTKYGAKATFFCLGKNAEMHPELFQRIVAEGHRIGNHTYSHQKGWRMSLEGYLEDIALMRVIPGMVVINPSDAVEARAAVQAAIEYVGPVYLRFGRAAVPVINDREDYKFEIGKGVLLREGTDVTIVATGICVSAALEAAEKLAEDGINAEVINIHTIKPLDEELIIKSAKKTGKVVTAEEHSIIGGLGGAVSEALSEKAPTPVCRIGMNDIFGESGSAGALVAKYGLDADGIYSKVKEFVK